MWIPRILQATQFWELVHVLKLPSLGTLAPNPCVDLPPSTCRIQVLGLKKIQPSNACILDADAMRDMESGVSQLGYSPFFMFYDLIMTFKFILCCKQLYNKKLISYKPFLVILSIPNDSDLKFLSCKSSQIL